MSESAATPTEVVLRHLAAASPLPWYPSAFARQAGVPRAELDRALDELRLAGLVGITDWTQALGQGYALTPLGKQVLQDPRALAALQRYGPAGLQIVAEPPPELPGSGQTTAWERGEAIRNTFLDDRKPYLTRVLIALNVLVFLVGGYLVQQQRPQDTSIYFQQGIPGTLHQLGAMSAEDVFGNGQFWRLLSCCFVHFGLLHLAGNMYSLYVLGPDLERMWGRLGFLALYLISGVGGSGVALLLLARPEVLLAGASGAIWGGMASELAWLLLNRGYLPPDLVARGLRQLGTVIFLNVLISMLPQISAAAHFGGGAYGFLAGVLLNAFRYSGGFTRLASVLGLALLAVSPFGAAILVREHPERFPPTVAGLAQLMKLQRSVAVLGTNFPRIVLEELQDQRFYHTRVLPLLNLPPDNREAKDVALIITELRQRATRLSANAEVLKNGRPQPDHMIDDMLSVGVEVMGSQAQIFLSTATCLEAGAGCPREQLDQLDLERQKLLLLHDRWLRFPMIAQLLVQTTRKVAR